MILTERKAETFLFSFWRAPFNEIVNAFEFQTRIQLIWLEHNGPTVRRGISRSFKILGKLYRQSRDGEWSRREERKKLKRRRRRRSRNYLFVRPSFRYKRAFMFAPCYARCFIKWNKFCSLSLSIQPPSLDCSLLSLFFFDFELLIFDATRTFHANGKYRCVNGRVRACMCLCSAGKCIRFDEKTESKRWFYF